MNCHECIHKRNNPGSAHIQCKHPSLKGVTDDPLVQLFGMFASVGRTPPINFSTKELNIRADPVGIKNGWFNFPIDFDPTWLRNCDGFEKLES